MDLATKLMAVWVLNSPENSENEGRWILRDSEVHGLQGKQADRETVHD